MRKRGVKVILRLALIVMFLASVNTAALAWADTDCSSDTVKGSTTTDVYPELCLVKPFDTETKIERFFEAFNVSVEDKKNLRPILPRILRIRYRFEMIKMRADCTIPFFCNSVPRDVPIYRVTREILYNLHDDVEGLEQRIYSQRFRHCGSSLNINNFSAIPLGHKRLLIQAFFEATKYACGDWPWGGTWKTEIGEATGDFSSSIFLDISKPDLINGVSPGSYVFRPSSVDTNISDSSLLGFVNAATLVGRAIDLFFRLTDFMINVRSFGLIELGYQDIDAIVADCNLSVGKFVNEENIGSVSGRLSYVANQIRDFRRYVKFIDINSAGFGSEAGDITFSHDIFGFLTNELLDFYYPRLKAYAEAVGSLDKEATRYQVVGGDSVWKIAQARLGSGYYGPILLYFNHRSFTNGTIRPGEVLLIPQPWQTFRAAEDLIRPGDTLWSRYVSRFGVPPVLKRLSVPDGSPDRDKIYTFQQVRY